MSVMKVTVCEDCRGQDCPDYQGQIARERTMGVSLRFNEENLESAILAFEELFLKSSATDADGIARSIPDGTPFAVHTFEHSPESDGEWAGMGAWVYCALYSGVTEPGEYLRGAAPWPDREVQRQIASLQGK